MRRTLAVSLSLNAALLAGIFLRGLDVQAVGAGPLPAGNGDVNGDGSIDISDPVYLLSHFFLGGPPPKPIPCPPAVPAGLPATGQTRCFLPDETTEGTLTECEAIPYPGQDASYQAGCPADGRFADAGDGTVTDTCTGLMWQKDTADVDGDGSIGLSDRVKWQDAIAYAEGLHLAGHSDWRLPNVRELQSLIHYGRYNPSIDLVFGAEPDGYWSSSYYAPVPSHAWYVFFVDGLSMIYNGDQYFFYLRAVRSAR